MAQLIALARDNRQELIRFLKFSVVGTIGAVVDFGTFNLMLKLLGLLGMAPLLRGVASQAISFSAAVMSNFLWNRYWTYPDSRSKPVMQQLGQFAIVSVISLAIRTPIFAALERPLGHWVASLSLTSSLPLTPAAIGSNLALATAVVIVLFWNFFINRVWTYNDVK